MYVLIGLLIVAAIVAFWWLAKHHVSPTLPAAKDVSVNVLSGLQPEFATLRDTFAEELSKVPALVSAEVQRLGADLTAVTARAEEAEAKLAAELQARDDFVEKIKSSVSAVVSTAAPAPVVVAAPPAEPAE